MNLNAGETGPLCRQRRRGEAADSLLDVGFRHGFRLTEEFAVFAEIKRHCRRCPDLAAHCSANLPPGMIYLHPDLRASLTRPTSPFDKFVKRRVRLEHDATGSVQCTSSDHYIASNDHPFPSAPPPPINS